MAISYAQRVLGQIKFHRLPAKLTQFFASLLGHHSQPITLVLPDSHRDRLKTNHRVFLAYLMDFKRFFIDLQKICIQGLFYNVRTCFLGLLDPVFEPFAYLLGQSKVGIYDNPARPLILLNSFVFKRDM